MLTAIVSMNVEREKLKDIAGQLADMDAVSEVYSVSGRYDLVAIVRVRESEELPEVVTGDMTQVRGITNTETAIAFRAYSRHDLESMFAIGT
mgnify:FL=1